jgi:hypothetical protein
LWWKIYIIPSVGLFAVDCTQCKYYLIFHQVSKGSVAAYNHKLDDILVSSLIIGRFITIYWLSNSYDDLFWVEPLDGFEVNSDGEWSSSIRSALDGSVRAGCEASRHIIEGKDWINHSNHSKMYCIVFS